MYISNITLKDIRGFTDLQFNLARDDGSFAGWTVFTGDNGSGKSRLQAKKRSGGVQAHLNQKQAETDRIRQEELRVVDLWRAARQTNLMRTVLAALKNMMGERERCMYCLDSHGTRFKADALPPPITVSRPPPGRN